MIFIVSDTYRTHSNKLRIPFNSMILKVHSFAFCFVNIQAVLFYGHTNILTDISINGDSVLLQAADLKAPIDDRVSGHIKTCK